LHFVNSLFHDIATFFNFFGFCQLKFSSASCFGNLPFLQKKGKQGTRLGGPYGDFYFSDKMEIIFQGLKKTQVGKMAS
jgi:hypothetical protein